jgi:hypothetical protein
MAPQYAVAQRGVAAGTMNPTTFERVIWQIALRLHEELKDLRQLAGHNREEIPNADNFGE